MSSIQGDEDSELVQENNGSDDNDESGESDAESDNGSDWSQRTQEYTFISNKLIPTGAISESRIMTLIRLV